MKFLCLTDYHGTTRFLPRLSKMIQSEEPDIIFYCGGTMKGDKRMAEYEAARRFHSKPDLDDTAIQQEISQDVEYLRQFLLALAETQRPTYVIPGYNDSPESVYFKTVYNYSQIYPNLKPAHEMIYREDAFVVAGFGGNMTVGEENREFVLQYSCTWAEFALRRVEYFTGDKILLFHSPPVCRLGLSEGEHCGVVLINEIIEKVSPKLVMCGKAKEGQGVVELGTTMVVNPGPFYEGKYAVIEYPSLDVRFNNLGSL